MPTPFRLTEAADLYDPAIQKMFLKASELDDKNFEKFCNVETGVEDYITKDSSLSGLGEAARISPENASIVGESPVQGFDQTYTQVEYGKLLAFTKKMWKFGIKKRDMTRVTKELYKACVRKRERLLTEKLENGWSTSYSHVDDGGNYTVTLSGADSVAMFSASHTREDGGTAWNNIITDGTTVNMDFDYDALKAARRTASLIKDPKGNPLSVQYDTFIFARGSSASFRAQEILGAIKKAHRPGTISAGDAGYDGPGVQAFSTIELPYMTNLEYYFGMDSSLKGETYGIQYMESQPIELEGPNLVFKTGEIQYKSTVMFAYGHTDARNMGGSKGTNS